MAQSQQQISKHDAKQARAKLERVRQRRTPVDSAHWRNVNPVTGRVGR